VQIQDNKTNAVEEAWLMSTLTFCWHRQLCNNPRAFTALDGRRGMGSKAVVTHCSCLCKNCCPTCPAYKSTHSLSGLKFVQNFSTYMRVYTVCTVIKITKNLPVIVAHFCQISPPHELRTQIVFRLCCQQHREHLL